MKPVNNTKKLYLSIGLLCLLGVIWGSGYSLAKYATENGVTPLGYSFWQSLGPAILLLLVSCTKKEKVRFQAKHLRFYLICGLIGIAIPNTNMYFTAAHLPAGLLAVIVNTVPIITYPIALLVGLERFHPLRLLGIIIGFLGIFFIILPHSSLPEMTMTPWALLTLISPLAFASCAVYIAKYRPPEISAVTLSTGMLISSSLLLLPLIIANHSFYPLTWPFSLPELVVIIEIILSSIGYVLFFKLLKLAGPVFYSLVGGVVALTGLAWGYIVFDEHLNSFNITAIVLILTAIGLVSLQQNTNKD